MYLVERLLGNLEPNTGNKIKLEGSITERYMEDKILNVCPFILPPTKFVIR